MTVNRALIILTLVAAVLVSTKSQAEKLETGYIMCRTKGQFETQLKSISRGEYRVTNGCMFTNNFSASSVTVEKNKVFSGKVKINIPEVGTFWTFREAITIQ